MPDKLDQLVSYDNLMWAWEKVRKYYSSVDTWLDEIRISAFESRLQRELFSIAQDLREKKYRTRSLKLLPQPKKPGRDKKPQLRQAFLVDVRDQVATVAYANIVGGELDEQMPNWSYGNRLFRSLRRIGTGSYQHTNIGPYRNSSGEIYRRWGQGWPLFKRHTILSLRKMCRRESGLDDDAEKAVLELEENALEKYRLPYLKDDFWHRYTENPVWCSLDIEKFYPSVSLELVRQQVLKHSEAAREIGSETLEALTTFSLDASRWSDEDLSAVQLTRGNASLGHIPTGLMIAGLFANVALLDVDRWVSGQIRTRQIAHFRYVDDHVILAPDLDSLLNWVVAYRDRLKADTKCIINPDKLEPKGIAKLLSSPNGGHYPPDLLDELQLDPEFPAPLMTKTLAKVSDIARTNFDLLTKEGQQRFLDDLEHLLLAPLPETELAVKTRVTFAAGRIARLVPKQERGEDQYFAAWHKTLELDQIVKKLDVRLKALKPDTREAKSTRALRKRKRTEQRVALRVLDDEQQKNKQARDTEMARIFKVLSKALREQYDKLRLWQRILDFGRFSGVPHVAAVFAEIERLDQPLAAVLVRAKILQLHARNILICAATVRDDRRSHNSRVAALEYLRDVFQAPNFRELTSSRGSSYHEKSSRELLTFSLRLCAEIIDEYPTLNEPVLNREWRNIRSSKKAILKLKQPRGDGYLWWREKMLFGLHIRLRSSKRAISHLNPQDPASWLIWECHPELTPLTALGMLLAGKIPLEAGAAGWLRDLIIARGGGKRDEVIEALRPAQGTIAAHVLKSARDTHTLYEWAGALDRFRDFDPRASEWTVLEICRQLCNILANNSLTPRSRLILSSHASNFSIPKSWWNSNATFGWNDWEQRCKRDLIQRRRNPISDHRIAAALGIFPDSPTEFSVVRAVGCILLGLLRRDFVWPMPWRVIGVQATLRGNIESYLQTRPCSSRTLAILEATLLARPYESWLLANQVEEAQLAGDTAADPPSIPTLKSLRSAIERSMKTLSEYRLTVTELQPRQLVPIKVSQYTKASWNEDDDSGGQIIG
jgi:hypothetical protein